MAVSWPISELSGLLDPDVYVPGYYPTGADVGADITQNLTKVNEAVVGANELKVDLDAEEALGVGRDARLDAHDTAISANQDNITQNQIDIIALEAADVALDARVTVNEADIATLEATVGLSMLEVAGDIADLDYATYGDYGQIVLIGTGSAKQSVTLPSVVGGSGQWPIGRTVKLICAHGYGALVPAGVTQEVDPDIDILLSEGDILECTVYSDDGDNYWALNRIDSAGRKSDVRELTATESLTLLSGLGDRMFIVSGQAAGNVAEVTLPAITDDLIGVEVKGFHHGTEGDLRFTCSGTDQILDLDGAEGDSIDVFEAAGRSVVTLTALPDISGVGYWAATIGGAFT